MKDRNRKRKKIVIVGGVAGGASCAARARRMAEDAEILVFERGPFVSFANCGLPYYVGDVIGKEESLLVASPKMFRAWFNIEVRTMSNVLAIDRQRREIEVRDMVKDLIYQESYDALVIAPGARPLKPPMPGIDHPAIFTLRDIPDANRLLACLSDKPAKRAAIVGAGFIGLEMAENLKKKGIHITLIEAEKQVMPALDPEMAAFIQDHLETAGIDLRLGAPVTGFRGERRDGIDVLLASGEAIEVDFIILAIGVRPEIDLAKNSGLTIGSLGGIKVNDRMQTSDEHIWAVGDAVEVEDFMTNMQTLVPLAGPANRQGRVAADAIVCDRPDTPRFRGVQATAVCGVLGLTVASTGLTEKALKRLEAAGKRNEYQKIYLHPANHAGYYPGAQTLALKLLFTVPDGRILGAQAVGGDGVEKRIDVISMAIQKKGTVFDLEEAELCYAPQYGSAKDPVNMAGMIAANVLRGDLDVVHWQDRNDSGQLVLDVRTPLEFKKSHFPGTVHIPLDQLRERMGELPRDREIWTYCHVGQRSYYAARILTQSGFRAANISGGYRLYEAIAKTDQGQSRRENEN